MRARDLWTTSVTFAWRALRASPGLSLVAVASLALAVGLVTCVAVMLDALVWRPIAVQSPERVIALQATNSGGTPSGFSVPEYRALESSAASMLLRPMAWVDDVVLNVETPSGLQLGNVWAVSDEFFATIGERAVRGRVFDRLSVDDETMGVVISHQLWTRAFAGRGDAIGKSLKIEGVPFTVVGVTRPDYTALSRGVAPTVTIRLADLHRVATHAGLPPDLSQNAAWRGLSVGGRLHDGMSESAGCASVRAAWARLLPQYRPGTAARQDGTLTCASVTRGINVRHVEVIARPLWGVLLLAAVLLAVGCVHVAELVLLTILAKRAELALRVAHGAPRLAIVLHVLTLVGAVVVAAVGIGATLALILGPHVTYAFLDRGVIAPAVTVTTDRRVVLAIVGVAASTALLCAVPVVWAATRMRPDEGLRGASTRTTATLRWPARVLIAAQTALATVLVLTASTLVMAARGWRSAAATPAARVTVARLYPQPQGYAGLDGAEYYPRLLSSVEALPGVERAALSNHEPGGAFVHERRVALEDGGAPRAIGVVVASPGLFATLGARVLQGREILWSDRESTEPIVVLGERLARVMFGGASPVGRRMYLSDDRTRPPARIVGVVTDVDVFDVRQRARPVAYTAWLQEPEYTPWAAQLLIRAQSADAEFAAPLREIVSAQGHEYVLWLGSSGAVTRRTLAGELVAAGAATALAAVASGLLVLGAFAAVAHVMARRRRELAIEMALGARARHLYAGALAFAVAPSAIGALMSLPLWWYTDRWLRVFVEELPPHSAGDVVLVFCITGGAVMLAGLLATCRAMQMRPLDALRD